MTTIKQWAESSEPSAIARVVKRLERFSGNTTDAATQACAGELVEMIKKEIKE